MLLFLNFMLNNGHWSIHNVQCAVEHVIMMQALEYTVAINSNIKL